MIVLISLYVCMANINIFINIYLNININIYLFIISTDEDPSLRIELNLRGVSTN